MGLNGSSLRGAAVWILEDILPELTFQFRVNYIEILYYLALVIGALGVGYLLYLICVRPTNMVKNLSDVGYRRTDGKDAKEIANFVRRTKKSGDLPPVYPNGWFALVDSGNLRKGEVEEVQLLGLHLAVFRDAKGEVYALDAYCPHLGANLGVGGRVFGDCLECPFHGWLFRGTDGKCTRIPYAEKVPEFARTKSYTVLETNDTVYIWYHADSKEPDWVPPTIENMSNGRFKFSGQTTHTVNCHIQEIPENGADLAHLNKLHYPTLLSGVDITDMHRSLWNIFQHHWGAQWSVNEECDKHISTLMVQHKLNVFGKKVPLLDVEVTINQIGPGLVYMYFPAFGVMLHHVVPVEPLLQRVTHKVYTHWAAPALLGNVVLLVESKQFERDVIVWNNKCYQSNPILVKSKEDEQIRKFRKWYSQFYSENSPKFTFKKEELDW